MILRIKKRDLILVLILLIVSLPLVYAVASAPRVGFKVELVISNRNPQINVSNATGFAVDLTAGGLVQVIISFNVTDADGAGNINASTAVVNFTLGGFAGQYYANASYTGSSEMGNCANTSLSSTVIMENCTVNLPYYANASANWVVNISIKDVSGGSARNDTIRFTINTVSGLSLPYGFVNFSSVNVGQANALAYPHLLINNTGNDDFVRINMTAAALIGTTTSSETIGVTNFGVNLTNSSSNQRASFPAAGNITLSDTLSGTFASLTHGHSGAFAPNADKGNISAFIWVNVPSSGLSSQLYNATWNITAANAG